MPVATERVGTAFGPVIDTVHGSGRPVRLDLAATSHASRPPSILYAGTLGSGKTMTSPLIAAQALERRSLVVGLDPKPDHQLKPAAPARRPQPAHRPKKLSRNSDRALDAVFAAVPE
jgi:hypothetical protein